MVAAHLIPQHFKVEHGHKLTMLSDEELQQKLAEAKAELERAA
jgi:ribosomal protein L29